MLLTIAIPTYNRMIYLERLLVHIEQEIESLHHLVKVIIIDNASSDGSVKIARAFVERNKNWELICQGNNLGMDRNFYTCYERNRSRYFWIIGDDDLPRMGLVRLAIDFLQSHEPTLLYFGSIWSSSIEATSMEPLSFIHPVAMNTKEFARNVNVWTTFLSAWIIDAFRLKDIGLTGTEVSDGIGTNLVQLGWLLPLLKDSSRLYLCEEKCIMATSGNTGGYQLLRTFAINYPDLVFKHFYNDRLIRNALIEPFLREYLPQLIRASSSGHFSKMEKEPAIFFAALPRLWAYKEFWSCTLPALMLTSIPTYKRDNAKLIWRGFRNFPSKSLDYFYNKVLLRVFMKFEKLLEKVQRDMRNEKKKAALKRLQKAGINISIPDDFDIIGHEFISIGSNFIATRGLRLHCWRKGSAGMRSRPCIEIGKGVFFNREAYVSCARSISIGDYALFGSNVLIVDNYHGSTRYIDLRRLGSSLACLDEVVIEEGAWIGNNVCILPGSHIGKGSIIGANSVVNSKIPEYSVAVGAPAKVVKYLRESE